MIDYDNVNSYGMKNPTFSSP